MNKNYLSILAIAGLCLVSCSDDNNNIPTNTNVTAPATYVFERNGNSTVSFSGQTTRIKMAEELIKALKVRGNNEAKLDAMFAHVKDANDFSDASLNASSKSIRSKTAASRDFFSSNAVEANAIKEKFDGWIKEQVDVVFPRWDDNASAGVAGVIQEAGGGSKRYVNGKGLELNQAINKGLIGALMVDQMLNNYLGKNVLDEGTNVADNDANTVASGKNYTNMEHKWDEAYGYLFGASPNAATPLTNIGNGSTQKGDDSFLNKYLDRVNDDTDFNDIAQNIYNALKLGRAAIVAKNYTVRDAQAKIIRDLVSKVIAIRAVYYLQQGKKNLAANKGAAFHDLSEGFGFIESLRFTRNTAANNAPYFTAAEINGFTTKLLEGNGFWDVTAATLDEISTSIAAKFDFTVAQAGS